MSKTCKLSKRGLALFYSLKNRFEIGIDEAGRGPMFGRVYAAAVVLPRNPDDFDHDAMRDSKKIKSIKNMENAAAHIRENAIAYSVCYEDENTIDEINIRQATHKAMKRAIFDTHLQLANLMSTDSEIHISDHSVCTEFLLVDGNDFTPFTYFDETQNKLMEIPHTTIEGGDNKFTPIAAASILAKYERDLYITNLCEEYPMLKERYGLDTNKGYGTKIHMDGIKAYGITKWHRKTFGICQEYATKLKKDSQKKEKKTQQKEKKK
jgi:ribonuclease HII